MFASHFSLICFLLMRCFPREMKNELFIDRKCDCFSTHNNMAMDVFACTVRYYLIYTHDLWLLSLCWMKCRQS